MSNQAEGKVSTEGIWEASVRGKKQGRKECIQCCKNCNRSVFARSRIRESRGKWKQRRRRREGAGEWKSWRGGGGKGKVGVLIWECYHSVQRPAQVSARKVSYSHHHLSHKADWTWLGFAKGRGIIMALPASLSTSEFGEASNSKSYGHDLACRCSDSLPACLQASFRWCKRVWSW